MLIRSLYETVLRAPEGDGAAAPEVIPADSGSTAPETTADTSQQGDEPPPMEEQLAKIWDDAHSPVGRDKLTGRFQSNKTPKVDTPTQVADDDLDDDIDSDLKEPGSERTTGDEDPDADLTAGEEDDGSDKRTTDAPPRSWSKIDPKEWASLPPAVKAMARQREADMAEVIGRAGNAVKFHKDNASIVAGVEPYRQYLQQREQVTGVPTGKLLNDVVRFAHGFDTAQSNEARLGILNEIISTFGIDIGPWIGREAADSLRAENTPSPEVEELRRRVAEMDERLQQRDEYEQQQSDLQLARAMRTFENNKKDYPYWNHVRNRMGAEIAMMSEQEANRPLEELIPDLYQRACWAHPKVRARLIRDQQRAQAETHEEKVTKAHARSEKAAATNVRSGVPSPSKRTMDDDIEATAARLYG